MVSLRWLRATSCGRSLSLKFDKNGIKDLLVGLFCIATFSCSGSGPKHLCRWPWLQPKRDWRCARESPWHTKLPGCSPIRTEAPSTHLMEKGLIYRACTGDQCVFCDDERTAQAHLSYWRSHPPDGQGKRTRRLESSAGVTGCYVPLGQNVC